MKKTLTEKEAVIAHHKNQLKRSKSYRKLLGIKVPNREFDKKVIVDELWYIIWEANLLKPKIFKYSFVSDIFAASFANKHLQDKPYYISKGKDLKEFGLLKVNIKLAYTGKKTIGTLPYKYDFPEGLSYQRKKTLRTMYRRNLRRSLLKLLKIENKKTMDIYILNKIEEKPGAFFKKLGKQWFYELTYSVTFKDWYIREEGWRIDEIVNAVTYPGYVSKVANIVTILEKDYSDEKYDYKNYTYTSLALYLYKTYKERIIKYMDKKGITPKLGLHEPEEAWRELVYRGFIPSKIAPIAFNPKKDAYILSLNPGFDLVYPKKVKDNTEAFELQQRFGVMGYTGVNQITGH